MQGPDARASLVTRFSDPLGGDPGTTSGGPLHSGGSAPLSVINWGSVQVSALGGLVHPLGRTCRVSEARVALVREAAQVGRDATTGDDEERWAQARSVLDRKPTEPAERRLRRTRRLLLLLVGAAVLVAGGVAAVAVVVLGDTAAVEPSHDVPTWQVVLGFVLSGLALVVMFVAVVAQFRANRRLGAWRNPLSVLTRGQRKELLAQVRGRAPVEAARVPLARYLAEALLSRRAAVVLNLGAAALWTGQWIALRMWWHLIAGGLVGAAAVIFWLTFRRDEVRARRFLEAHPARDSVA